MGDITVFTGMLYMILAVLLTYSYFTGGDESIWSIIVSFAFGSTLFLLGMWDKWNTLRKDKKLKKIIADQACNYYCKKVCEHSKDEEKYEECSSCFKRFIIRRGIEEAQTTNYISDISNSDKKLEKYE